MAVRSFGQFVDSIGTPRGWAGALRDLRAEHGRHTADYLADRYGVARRTAERWLAGTHAPRSGEVRADLPDLPDRNRTAARQIRDAQYIQADVIRLDYPIKGGERKVPHGGWRVTEAVRDRLAEVADALDAGDRARAEREFGGVIADLYFAGPGAASRKRTRADGMSVDGYGAGFRLIGR